MTAVDQEPWLRACISSQLKEMIDFKTRQIGHLKAEVLMQNAPDATPPELEEPKIYDDNSSLAAELPRSKQRDHCRAYVAKIDTRGKSINVLLCDGQTSIPATLTAKAIGRNMPEDHIQRGAVLRIAAAVLMATPLGDQTKQVRLIINRYKYLDSNPARTSDDIIQNLVPMRSDPTASAAIRTLLNLYNEQSHLERLRQDNSDDDSDCASIISRPGELPAPADHSLVQTAGIPNTTAQLDPASPDLSSPNFATQVPDMPIAQVNDPAPSSLLPESTPVDPRLVLAKPFALIKESLQTAPTNRAAALLKVLNVRSVTTPANAPATSDHVKRLGNSDVEPISALKLPEIATMPATKGYSHRTEPKPLFISDELESLPDAQPSPIQAPTIVKDGPNLSKLQKQEPRPELESKARQRPALEASVIEPITKTSTHVLPTYGTCRMPDARFLKYAQRQIPSAQRALLDLDASWLPSLPSMRFPPSNVPVAIISRLSSTHGRLQQLRPEENAANREHVHSPKRHDLPQTVNHASDEENSTCMSWSVTPSQRRQLPPGALPPDSSADQPSPVNRKSVDLTRSVTPESANNDADGDLPMGLPRALVSNASQYSTRKSPEVHVKATPTPRPNMSAHIDRRAATPHTRHAALDHQCSLDTGYAQTRGSKRSLQSDTPGKIHITSSSDRASKRSKHDHNTDYGQSTFQAVPDSSANYAASASERSTRYHNPRPRSRQASIVSRDHNPRDMPPPSSVSSRRASDHASRSSRGYDDHSRRSPPDRQRASQHSTTSHADTSEMSQIDFKPATRYTHQPGMPFDSRTRPERRQDPDILPPSGPRRVSTSNRSSASRPPRSETSSTRVKTPLQGTHIRFYDKADEVSENDRQRDKDYMHPSRRSEAREQMSPRSRDYDYGIQDRPRQEPIRDQRGSQRPRVVAGSQTQHSSRGHTPRGPRFDRDGYSMHGSERTQHGYHDDRRGHQRYLVSSVRHAEPIAVIGQPGDRQSVTPDRQSETLGSAPEPPGVYTVFVRDYLALGSRPELNAFTSISPTQMVEASLAERRQRRSILREARNKLESTPRESDDPVV